MFSVFCETLGAEVLLGPHAVLTIRNTPQGPVTVYRCSCGRLGLLAAGEAVPGHFEEPVAVGV